MKYNYNNRKNIVYVIAFITESNNALLYIYIYIYIYKFVKYYCIIVLLINIQNYRYIS